MGIRKRIGLMAGMVVAVSAAAPTSANAIPNPLDLFDAMDPTKLVGKVLDLVFKWMFGYTPGELAGKVLTAVIANPDLGGDLFGPLREGVHQLIPAAVALLVLFFLTGLSYSLATDPSRAGIDVFKRLAVAIVGIIALPQLFEQFNTFIGYVARAVISTPMVQDSVAKGLDGALGGGTAGAVFGGLAVVLLLILLCAKIVILALLAILYIATPFVMASFVDPRMSHIAGVWLQSTALIQFVPVAWSGILLAFGAVGTGGKLFSGVGLDANFVNMAVALTLLAMLVFSIPVMLRMAWIGGFIPSLRGAGAMAWGGAQVAGALGGGGVDLPALEQNAQDVMDDAAAPPAAEGDRRGGAGGPAMDFGAGSDEETFGGFASPTSQPSDPVGEAAPSQAAAPPAGSSDDVDSAAAPSEDLAGSPAASADDDRSATTDDGPAGPTAGDEGATVGAATAGDSAAVDRADVPGGGAGDPLPASASDVVAATSSTSAPTPAGAADATPLASDGDGGGASATTSLTSSPEEGAVSVPMALDGGDVRAASTAAPVDALDVAAPEPAPAVTDPEQETPQR